MKQITIIFTTVLLLAGTLGITVISHYCEGHNKVVDTQFYASASSCCSAEKAESKCIPKHSEKQSCCKKSQQNSCSDQSDSEQNSCCSDLIYSFKVEDVVSLQNKMLPQPHECVSLQFHLNEHTQSHRRIYQLSRYIFHDVESLQHSTYPPIFLSNLSILC